MHALSEQTVPEVGTLTFEVFGAGRTGRRTSSRFTLRCDGVGLHSDEMLFLSVVGPETSVKALTAGLRASGRDQQRIDYSVHVGPVHGTHLVKCADGYRVHRARLEYGLWHVVCVARREGFLPVLTEETLWQQLRGERFTTPLVQEWLPWLYSEMKRQGMLIELIQCGCQAGLLLAEDKALDALVSAGVRDRFLSIEAGKGRNQRREVAGNMHSVTNLDDYLRAYGPLLGKQAERSLEPLHVPGRDAVPALPVLRAPFEAQAHVVEACRKALCRQKALLLVGEMGTGKTLMALSAVHAHADGAPYRALVFCPGQLVHKWEREIRETIPGVTVTQLRTWKDLLRLEAIQRPTGAVWHIIARDRAKLGARRRPAYMRRGHLKEDWLRCPQCGLRLVDKDRVPLEVGRPAESGRSGSGLWKRRSRCEWVLTNRDDHLTEGCGAPLWQMTGELQRYEPALYIKRRLRHYFRYLILDEVHEEKGHDTAQGHAAAALAASCRKVLALTGTLIGGYAEHLRPLLYRLAPRSLTQEGLGWSEVTAFNERYGRIETRITERTGCRGEDDNRMSRGSRSTTKSVRPGIMPPLFGRHLIDKAVFLGLAEVADNLPVLEEECLPVRMDAELARAYRQDVEEPLAAAIKEMIRRKDRRLLGVMVQTLLAYPDYPFGWGPIGYRAKSDGGAPVAFVTVATPPSLPENVIRPKEQALLDLVSSQRNRGRKVWVYVQYTDRHDVQARLEQLLRQAGLRVGMLRASVPLAEREGWIARHAPALDVVISQPRLVETGLDLFAKDGSYNFPTLCFYEK